MALLFLPLLRTATNTSCSSNTLLVATFTQHLASHPTSAPLLTTSSPLPSPLAVTSHQDQKGLMPLLALLLLSLYPFSRPLLCYQANSSQDCPWKSHHLLALSKSVCYSKWSNATSCASPMLMHFSRLPCIYQALSCQSSHHEQSFISVTKQAGHELLPYKPNHFCTFYQQ